MTNGADFVTMHEEVAGAFERAVTGSIAPRDVVGGDPVQFADRLLERYSSGDWTDKERRRLRAAFGDADGGGRS